MRRTDDQEVMPVQRSDLGLAETFQQGNDAGVHNANGEARIALLELPCSAQVTISRPLNPPGACLDILHEGEPGGINPELSTPVV